MNRTTSSNLATAFFSSFESELLRTWSPHVRSQKNIQESLSEPIKYLRIRSWLWFDARFLASATSGLILSWPTGRAGGGLGFVMFRLLRLLDRERAEENSETSQISTECEAQHNMWWLLLWRRGGVQERRMQAFTMHISALPLLPSMAVSQQFVAASRGAVSELALLCDIRPRTCRLISRYTPSVISCSSCGVSARFTHLPLITT